MEHTHFIGIGGIGMSSLAKLLLGKKKTVSGSDTSVTYITEGLEKDGAKIYRGQSASNIRPSMRVVYSSDIKKDNAEYQAALQLKCVMIHRSDLLAELANTYRSIAVAGTHGKTTTSSLLSAVLVESGLDPSFSVGGIIAQYHSNARVGQSDLFAFEADESDGTFLKYTPFGAIVTNIDNDHLCNFEGSEDKLEASFGIFMNQVVYPQHLFWCGDDKRLTKLGQPGQSYGFDSHCEWRISHFRQKGFKIYFDLEHKNKKYKDIEVALTGQHNASNAAAVFGLCITLGIKEDSIRNALKDFQGVYRRCQIKGEQNGVLFIDDYAHHPTEIKATLKAIRKAVRERKIICVFQPHRYSRTKDCLGQYGDIFNYADELIVTDIFSAGESPEPGVTTEAILEEVRTNSTIPAHHISRSNLAEKIKEKLRPHDVVVTLGAGDVTKVCDEVIKIKSKEQIRKLKVGLIYGGKSTEHEISLRSAQNFIDSLRPEFYDSIHFGITKQGGWIEGPETKAKLENEYVENGFSSNVIEKLFQCDVLIPILHGPYGEDGTIQGFFEMFGKAYVGCDHRSSAISMNKVFSKELAMLKGVRTSPYVDYRIESWQSDPETFVKQVFEKLKFPVFVKPSHLGSSIAIHKVTDPLKLREAIDDAFKYDTQVLVEEGIVNCREIEFAVLGNDYVEVFPPGEILAQGRVYDYAAKYAKGGFNVVPNAELTSAQIEEGCNLAKKVFNAIGCCGLSRIDFFLDEKGEYWFNETNPLPGFTSISLYPQICKKNGLSGPDLMDRLIILALHRKRQGDRCKLHSKESEVLGK